MRQSLLPLIIVFVAILPAPLSAWGPIGHMAVDYVAYEQLTPATKARVRDLLKLNPAYATWEKQLPVVISSEDHDRIIFMIAATWADDIKGDAQYSDDGPDANTQDSGTSRQNTGYSDLLRHRYWHYIDIPFSGDGSALPATLHPNAETQIDAFRAVLKSDQPDELKSYDLVWLVHLIGDIHQPLHATGRVSQANPKGDAGGNNVKLMGDAASNLHSYWDDLPGADCTYCKDKVRCADRAVVYAKQLKAPAAKAAHNTSTAAWVQESFQLARSQVYRAPISAGDGPYTIIPQSAYEISAYRLAQKRVALAGARLGEVLNQELK